MFPSPFLPRPLLKEEIHEFKQPANIEKQNETAPSGGAPSGGARNKTNETPPSGGASSGGDNEEEKDDSHKHQNHNGGQEDNITETEFIKILSKYHQNKIKCCKCNELKHRNLFSKTLVCVVSKIELALL